MTSTTTLPGASTVAPGPDDEDLAIERFRTVAPVLLTDGELTAPEQADPGTLLDALVRSVRADPRPERVWLLSTAATARFPDADEFLRTRRELELADDVDAALWLLDRALEGPHDTRGWRLELLVDAVVVDVDFSARHELHTGIQRVVRSTLPHWTRRGVVPVVWTPGPSAYRRCSAEESARVLRWGSSSEPAPGPAALPRTPDAVGDTDPTTVDAVGTSTTLVVPWNSRVVLMEVPPRGATSRLATLAQYSANEVVGIGYDCIPVVSGLLLPPAEPGKFVDHLTVVKHMRRVAGISSSATLEFRGFTDMLGAQGLTGPVVDECALPVAGVETTPGAEADVPSVLCVGSFEPRKNQAAVLYAAEVLWREGLQFRLRFVGGGGWGTAFPREIRRLRRAGRAVEQLTAISEDELAAAYAGSRFTVFVSVHEGYGLPVAESFAHGVPALVTGYGSVAEIGEFGGVLEVDPRDDDVVDGMRRLLTDDTLLARLRAEVAGRPTSSWAEYADRLWSHLLGGARA